jgi:hypothetical protein
MTKNALASFSVDVEKDLHTGKNQGITTGIPKILDILAKHKIKATFFVTGEVLKGYQKQIKSVFEQGHEIGIHGYTHKRFDSMTSNQKEEEIYKSVSLYKKLFKIQPKGFRAPQHSIDKETLSILEKNGLKYDSSVCSKNLILLRHLLKKDSSKLEIMRNFFSKSKSYKISKALIEVPRSSPLLALGGFELKVYPYFLLVFILNLHSLFKIPLNFVMHSWDMIDTPGSKTSKICPSKKFEIILDSFIKEMKKRYTFVKMERLA